MALIQAVIGWAMAVNDKSNWAKRPNAEEEAAYIELKFVLGKRLQDYRKARRFTQTELARRIKSSQSRVAKMEAGDPSVSIDLLIRSLFALGASENIWPIWWHDSYISHSIEFRFSMQLCMRGKNNIAMLVEI